MRVNSIYMDYQATTPVDKRVFEAMVPYLTEKFGNPHSAEHVYGWEAEAAVNVARSYVAQVIGADESEIIFTSGATEANNMALKGLAEFYHPNKNHIITCQTEHKCILETCQYLEKKGFHITYLPVDEAGHISLELLEKSITPRTLVVSLMMVNNEIGVIHPIQQIGEICRKNGVFFHTDAAQSFGKIPINVETMQIDLLSLSGHKIYGPKGVGALYIRKRSKLRLTPLIHGGGQERGLRSGTVATHQVVGLGEAAKIASHEYANDMRHIQHLSDLFLTQLENTLSDVYLNGDNQNRIAGNLNIRFEGTHADRLILLLKNIAVSSGSACASASTEPSYVLQSIGLTKDQINASIRFSIGRMMSEVEIKKVAEQVILAVKKERNHH